MILLEFYKRIEFSILRLLWFIKFWKIWKNSLIKYGSYWWTSNIIIWDYVYIGDNWAYWGEGWIYIWSWTIIWPKVTIRSRNHNYKNAKYLPYDQEVEDKPVYIGENCWIWDSVMIAPWTVLGEGSIVWMGSVISGKYEPHSLIVWNPWRKIKDLYTASYDKKKKDSLIYLKHKDNSIYWRLKQLLIRKLPNTYK